MRPLGLRITFELVLGAVFIASLVMLLHQWRRINEYKCRQEADAQTMRLLQEALHLKGLPKATTAAPEDLRLGADRALMAQREQVIERLDQELAKSQATIADLQTQLSSANDQNAKALAGIQQQLQKQQADSQAQLEDLQKKLDAAISESDIARQRVAALEADNAKLKMDTTVTTTRAADVARIISNLQDLDRRRDVYLTSILRRYRDITGEFRAMSSMLDTSHDPNSGACSGTVLSRIQNAVNMTEDDLNQVNELNARIQKQQKLLTKK